MAPIRVATLALAAAILATFPASATTLVHHGLDQLAKDNDVIVRGKVLSTHSYWNPGHSFILTDVRLAPLEVLKGGPSSDSGELSFTIMGGTVGDVSVLVVDGPSLIPGSEYVLFLGRSHLPGARDLLTIRDLGQGVFEVAHGRATSQARDAVLLPDATGRSDVPGGDDGFALEELIRQIREHVHR